MGLKIKCGKMGGIRFPEQADGRPGVPVKGVTGAAQTMFPGWAETLDIIVDRIRGFGVEAQLSAAAGGYRRPSTQHPADRGKFVRRSGDCGRIRRCRSLRSSDSEGGEFHNGGGSAGRLLAIRQRQKGVVGDQVRTACSQPPLVGLRRDGRVALP